MNKTEPVLSPDRIFQPQFYLIKAKFLCEKLLRTWDFEVFVCFILNFRIWLSPKYLVTSCFSQDQLNCAVVIKNSIVEAKQDKSLFFYPCFRVHIGSLELCSIESLRKLSHWLSFIIQFNIFWAFHFMRVWKHIYSVYIICRACLSEKSTFSFA